MQLVKLGILGLLWSFLLNINCAYADNKLPTTVVTQQYGPVQVLVLSGNYHDMGVEYGKTLAKQLRHILAIIKDFYIDKHDVSYAELRKQGQLFYERFPYKYQQFILGVARGADLKVEDVKIINAMETLGELLAEQQGQCAFVFVPPKHTQTHSALIGRNYDYPKPFDKLAKYLTITVLHEQGEIPVAIIGIAGEIYCTTCINSKGLFLEINNGMPSGGDYVDQQRQTLLASALHVMQSAHDMKQALKLLNSIQSDYSLILNIANMQHVMSFEYSSTLGMKRFLIDQATPFVSTNFFQNLAWKDLPEVTDETTWNGLLRRSQLLQSINMTSRLDIDILQEIMDKTLEDGGAVWANTIYQLMLDTNNMKLYVKINPVHSAWQTIPMQELFFQTGGSE